MQYVMSQPWHCKLRIKTYLGGDFENNYVKTGLNLKGLILSGIFMISDGCKAFGHTWHQIFVY